MKPIGMEKPPILGMTLKGSVIMNNPYRVSGLNIIFLFRWVTPIAVTKSPFGAMGPSLNNKLTKQQNNPLRGYGPQSE